MRNNSPKNKIRYLALLRVYRACCSGSFIHSFIYLLSKWHV